MGRAADRPPAELGVRDAPGQHLDALPPQQLDVGPLLRPLGQPEHHHFRAQLAPVLREMRADEAGTPRDQEPHP